MLPFEGHTPKHIEDVHASQRQASSPGPRVPLKFLRSVTPYPAGAVAGFTTEVALSLLEDGAARFLTQYERERLNEKLPTFEQVKQSGLELAWATANPKVIAALKALDAEQRKAAGLAALDIIVPAPPLKPRPPMYECSEKDCGFTADSVEQAQAHADDGREHLLARLRGEGPLITPRQVLERKAAREAAVEAAGQPVKITTPEEHKTALAEAEAMIEQEPPQEGTPAHARLNALVTALDAYERVAFPVKAEVGDQPPQNPVAPVPVAPPAEPLPQAPIAPPAPAQAATQATTAEPVVQAGEPTKPLPTPPAPGTVVGDCAPPHKAGVMGAINRAIRGSNSKPPKPGQGK